MIRQLMGYSLSCDGCGWNLVRLDSESHYEDLTRLSVKAFDLTTTISRPAKEPTP